MTNVKSNVQSLDKIQTAQRWDVKSLGWKSFFELSGENVLDEKFVKVLHNSFSKPFWETQNRRLKGSDQQENRRVWSNINTRYLVWGCGDGRSFVL
jgi:hypothetical protein